jgi:hypothetical protein
LASSGRADVFQVRVGRNKTKSGEWQKAFQNVGPRTGGIEVREALFEKKGIVVAPADLVH